MKFSSRPPARLPGGAALLAFIFYCGIIVLITWPWMPQAAEVLRDPGDPALFVWTLHWLAGTAFHDPAALYAGPIFHGFPDPVTYTDTSLLPALALAPLWQAPNHVLFLNLLMGLTLMLDAFAAFLLVRALTGSALGGFVGGLVFACNSYMLAHLSHLNLLSLYFLPLALLAVQRLGVAGRTGAGRWALVGLALALMGQLLSSFYGLAYVLIAVAGALGWLVLTRRPWARWPAPLTRRLFGGLGGVGLAFGALGLVVTLPYWHTRQVMGFARTADDWRTWSAQPLDFLAVSLHNWTWAGLLPVRDPDPLFAGFTALALAAVGGFSGWRLARRRPVVARPDRLPRGPFGFYALLGLVGAILCLGPELNWNGMQIPLPYSLITRLPVGEALRAPVRAAPLVFLGLAVFAGWGTVRVLRRLTRLPVFQPPVLRRVACAGLVAGLAGLMLVEQRVAPLALTPVPATAEAQPAVYRWLADHPDGGVLVELTAGTGLADPTVDTMHMYYQTFHGHPLVNGYSGFRPPAYVEMFSLFNRQYSQFTPAQLGLLQSLDVRYVLYHSINYKSNAWQQVQTDLAGFPEMQLVGAFATAEGPPAYLYRLAPRPAGAQIGITVLPAADGTRATVRLTNPGPYPLLTRLRPTLDLVAANGAQVAVMIPLLMVPTTAEFTVPISGPRPPPGTAWQPVAPAPPSITVAPPALAGP